MASATVIVTPFVCVEAALPLELPVPEHPATVRLRQATPATSTAPLVWFRIDFICSGLPWWHWCSDALTCDAQIAH